MTIPIDFSKGDPDVRLPGRDDDLEGSIMGQLQFHAKKFICFGIAGMVLTILLVSVLIIEGERHSISELAIRNITKRYERNIDFNKSFRELHALDSNPCSGAHLSAMRKIVFGSLIIRDVFYRNDFQHCSGAGIDALALNLREQPDFITETGRKIWANIELPFAKGIKSILALEGDYGMLIAPPDSQDIESGHYQISTVLLNRIDGSVRLTRGPEHELNADSLVSNQPFWSGQNLKSVACVPEGAICYVLSISGMSLLRSYGLALAASGLIGFLLSSVLTAAFAARKFRSGTLDALLRGAIKRDELFMHYQPIVDSRKGSIVSAEALMRWTLPSGISVSPAVFIPIAEQAGLITSLTCLAIRKVSGDFGNFLKQNDFKISINIASADMIHEEFYRALNDHFEEQKISPAQIAFEVTERSSIGLDAEADVLRDLGRKGYEIYIDDFGTGYSNFSYLSDLPVQKIKLDKIFTDAACTLSLRERIIPSIIDLAKDLNVEVIAEGVENSMQVSYFQKRGVYLMQGWFYSRPVPAAALIESLKTQAHIRPKCVPYDS